MVYANLQANEARALLHLAIDGAKAQGYRLNQVPITVLRAAYRSAAGPIRQILTINDFYGSSEVVEQLNLVRSELQNLADAQGWIFRSGEDVGSADAAAHAEGRLAMLVEELVESDEILPGSLVAGGISTAAGFCSICAANLGVQVAPDGLRIAAELGVKMILAF